ncbi:MAG: hypothetical protein ABSF28_16525 [Terracidiphilus sp.]|jgi:hypothetical protein
MDQRPFRFKRELVSVGVVVAFLAIYLPFMDERWSLYVALCAGYTMLVFGMLWSDRKWKKYIEINKRTALELVQGHAMFLIVVVFWIWVCKISKPWLPDWMFEDHYRGITPHLVLGGLGLVAIWWIEQSWLAKPAKRDGNVEASTQ